MPTPIAQMQARFSQGGRIRTGWKKAGQMQKSETFILSSHDKTALEAAAGLYGGTVGPWPDTKSDPWRLFTDVKELPCLVVPVKETSCYEMWNGSNTCLRRCDGTTEEISGRPCMCPADTKSWIDQRKGGHACSFVMRVTVWLHQLPGVNTWRLDTKSYFAGLEVPAATQLLRNAAARNLYIPVTLAIEKGKSGNKVFNKPVIRFPISMEQMLQLTASATTPELPRLITADMLRDGIPQLDAPRPLLALSAPKAAEYDAASSETDDIDVEYDGETDDTFVLPKLPVSFIDRMDLLSLPDLNYIVCPQCGQTVAHIDFPKSEQFPNGKAMYYDFSGKAHKHGSNSDWGSPDAQDLIARAL